MPEFHTMSVSEAIAQFLKSKNVQYAFGIGGHGNTPTLAAIRPLHENGDITVLGLQHETVATHAATALKLVYGIESIVFTSIGPGYENTIIGQSTASNNGVGFLIFAGDRNLSYSSRNMQQILNEGQFGLSELGKSAGRGRYVVTTPDMIQQMLPAAWARAHRTGRQGPVNIMMPMDMQSPKYDYNLDILLRKEAPYNAAVRPDTQQVQQAVEMISRHNRIVMRIGGGARKAGESIIRFSEKTGAQIILSPNCDAVVSDYPANRNIAGSKGSIIGNFAAETATLVIDVAGRGVCQSTCSGTLYQNRREFMKINVDEEDALREGGVLAVVGDAVECLEAITKELVNREYTSTPDPDWLTQLETKEQEWQDYLQQRRNNPVIDGKLTQPAVIMAVDDFINSYEGLKIFDAGDVQAHGFITRHVKPGRYISETGNSCMGFGIAAAFALGLKRNIYPTAISGDGSAFINISAIRDMVKYHSNCTVLILDNQAMAAISALERAQQFVPYATEDPEGTQPVDFAALAESMGAKGISVTEPSIDSVVAALREAKEYDGPAVVDVKVYNGVDPMGVIEPCGRWEVDPWSPDVKAFRESKSGSRIKA